MSDSDLSDWSAESVDTGMLEATPGSTELDGLSGFASAPTMRPMLRRGALIGRYVVLSKLGAGGMGVVYAVHDPELDRKVALKLLHPLVESQADPGRVKEARARLVREALALAKLNHPNIVAVHDAGEHEGAVWLAMEFVDGQTLGGWMKARRHSWREVLDVLTPAARGLGAAHEAGLVHRDIKPENIMLGSDGRVRVMDLGLARTLADDSGASPQTASPNGLAGRAFDGTAGGLGRVWGEAETVAAGGGGLAYDEESDVGGERLAASVTRTGAVLGTPAYMSPEQFAGRVADARTDVFSLCVTLWEALFGERPFTGATVMDLATNVMSGAVRPVPRDMHSKSVPTWLRRVCLRGLAVAPEARYASMQELLAAFASGRRRARVWKLLTGVTAAAVLGASAVAYQAYDRAQRVAACEADGATVAQVWNEDARTAVREGLVATEVSNAETTAHKVMPWLDDAAQAWQEARTGACMSTRVERAWSEEMLDRAVWCLDERRDELDALVAELSQAQDKTVQKAVSAAAGLSSPAVCTDPSVLGALPKPPPAESRAQVAKLRRDLSRARALQAAGQYDEGLEVTRAALEQAEDLDWPPLTAAARRLEGKLLEETGEYADAEAASYAAYMEAAKVRAWDVAARAATNLVFIVGEHQARHDEGKVWAGHAEVAILMLGDPLQLREAARLNNLGVVHGNIGDHAEARAAYERALAIWGKALGPEHPHVAVTLSNLGLVHRRMGDHDEARALFERSVAIREKALGPEHPEVAESLGNLGSVHWAMGNHAEARALMERGLAIHEKALGPAHPTVARSLNDLGIVHWATGELDEARVLYERGLVIKEKALGPEHPDLARTLTNLGFVHRRMGDHAEARALFERALAIEEKALGPDHPQVASTLHNLGMVHYSMSDHAGAKGLFERALAIKEKALGPEHPKVISSLTGLGESYQVMGEHAEARARFERALAVAEKALGPEHLWVASVLDSLGDLALEQKRPQEALELFERAVGIFDAHEGVQENEAEVRLGLARALVAAGGDTKRARAQANEAAKAYREAGNSEELAKAEAFLKQHGADK